MAPARTGKPPTGNPAGRWRIVEMELWDMADADLLGPAFIQFKANGGGSFRFIAVTGDIDWKREGSRAEFSWSGFDEMDRATGRGWAEVNPDGSLRGRIFFHGGDASDFRAERGLSK